MYADEAVAIVNVMACKPGYTIRARRFGPWEMGVSIALATVDSSYPPDFPHPVNTGTFRLIRTDSLRNEVDIAGMLHQIGMDMESHEWREFLATQQPSGRWVAPLHPHTEEGQRNFAAVKDREFAMSGG
jgi:hypothetical protein